MSLALHLYGRRENMYGNFGKGLRENYKPFLQNSVGLIDLLVLIKVDKDDSL